MSLKKGTPRKIYKQDYTEKSRCDTLLSICVILFCKIMKLFDEEVIVKADYDNFYLDDVFAQKEYKGIYADMMSTRKKQISFLNKGLCGNGGTTGLIRYALTNNKGLLVLVPNVSICKSKESEYQDNPDVCCVYGGSKDFNAGAQVVIATYDQFSFLLQRLSQANVKSGGDIWEMTFWGGRTIVIDEYHKLIDDSGYRKVCYKMTELITQTDSPFVLMSATPNNDYIKMLRDLLPERIIYNYMVQYHKAISRYNTRIDVYEVKQKELRSIFKNMLDSPNNNHICVFYNYVKEIKGLLGHIGDDRCEVLCSYDSRDKVGKYYSDCFNPDKKLHFMTSAYFTGNDIWTAVDKCVILGSAEFDYMALNERDIKQIIGRFRVKYEVDGEQTGGVRMEGVQLFYMKKKVNQHNYMQNKNKYEKIKKDFEKLGDKWKEFSFGIEMVQDLLRTKDALRRYDMWSEYEHLAKALTDYGFEVNKVNTDFLKDMKLADKKKHLTFQAAKERLKKGEDVDFDDYPDINELKKFKEIKGMKEMMSKRNSKQDIHNWYKVYKLSQGKDLNVDKCKLPDVFGIQTFGRYNAKYLNACLVFLDDQSDYDNLAANMYDKMVCYAVPWELDRSGHKQNNTWLVITSSPKNEGKKDVIYKETESKIPPKFGEQVINSHISYETSNQGRSYAKTTTIDEAVKTGLFFKLSGIPLYDWVNEDKEHRLPEVKKGKDWTNIKRFKQSKISELYSDTDKVYRYIKSEMNLADCLIIDLDGGISYSEFKEKFGKWSWVAYPTISNVSENWTKFRVIIPLAHTVRLEGEYNLRVLKCLRTMFCPYEDPEHQLYSYVNLEDFLKLKTNEGETYDIPQEFVDCLVMCIRESNDFNCRKFEKKKVKVNWNSGGDMTLNDAKALFLKKLADPEEGARHKVLFYIKKSLSQADRDEFEDWLVKTAGARYLTHWKSHRV